MSKTDTDVIVTQYPAAFGNRPPVSTIDFRGPKTWRISGHWFYQERFSRRRKWTMVRDLLKRENLEALDITESLRSIHPGVFIDALDKDAKAILIGRDKYAKILLIEEVKR